MIEINLDIPESDVANLRDMSTRYVAFLRGNADKALQKIAVKLALALRASTKGTRQPPKKRPVVRNPFYGRSQKKRDKIKQHISEYYQATNPKRDNINPDKDSATFLSRFSVHRIRRGKKVLMPIAGKRKDATKSPLREIKKRGLADASWFWMLGRMGKSQGKQPPAGVTAKGNVVAFSKPASSGNDRFVTLWNKLNYIRKAFFTSGPTAINSVLGRTATMMRKEMERAEQSARSASGLGKPGP